MCEILVVEQEEGLREVLLSLLIQGGYDPYAVGSMAEALYTLNTMDPDILIVDESLPNGDLDSFLRIITGLAKETVVTGYYSPEVRDDVRDHGLVFLPKPYNEEDMITLIDGIMENRAIPERAIDERPRNNERRITDDVNMHEIYQKIAVVSSRVIEVRKQQERHEGRVERVIKMADDDVARGIESIAQIKDQIREELRNIPELSNKIDRLDERTADCDKRRIRLALVEERQDVAGVNWDRIVSIVLYLIQALVTAALLQALSQVR